VSECGLEASTTATMDTAQAQAPNPLTQPHPYPPTSIPMRFIFGFCCSSAGKNALRHMMEPGRMTAAPASVPSATIRRGLWMAWPSFHSAASTTVPMPAIGSGRLLLGGGVRVGRGWTEDLAKASSVPKLLHYHCTAVLLLPYTPMHTPTSPSKANPIAHRYSSDLRDT